MHMNRELSLLLLFAAVLGMIVSSSLSSYIVIASTDEESGGEEGGGSDDENGGGGGNGNGDEPEPEPESEPEPIVEPEPEPLPELPLASEDLTVIDEPVLVECPDGSQVENIEDCPLPIVAPTELPLCDGSAQDCITPNGDICLEGQGGHECECAEDMSDCPNHPSLLPPLESPFPDPKPLPYCHKVPEDYQGACHDILDYDEETGLYPCNDGTQEKDWRDCEDAYVPPPEPCNPENDTNCEPVDCIAVEGAECLPSQCKEGYKLVNGKCVLKDDEDEKEKKRHKDITIIINNIIKETNEGKHKDAFPDVDIIGLSVKENGEAIICAMDIDSDHIQCQEFAMENSKVNQDFWRVIETDHDNDYDNGNTGSSDIDDAIEDIKSQDFSELDDADNHDFGIDLAFVAINPQGDGVTCLNTDQSGKGKSLCEPFKVSSADVSGQITEGVQID